MIVSDGLVRLSLTADGSSRPHETGLHAQSSQRITMPRADPPSATADAPSEGGTPILAGSESDGPRYLEGAQPRPRRDVSAMALAAGFEVYGMCKQPDEPPSVKRQRLLLVLRSRAVVYVEPAVGGSVLRELLMAFLDGGGYAGVGYPALRAHSQRKLSQLVQVHATKPPALPLWLARLQSLQPWTL